MVAEKSLSFQGHPLDLSPQNFDELRRSADALGHVHELQQRFDDDGYLYLPGLLDRERVLAARMEQLVEGIRLC